MLLDIYPLQGKLRNLIDVFVYNAVEKYLYSTYCATFG